jgi:hypothetical protein
MVRGKDRVLEVLGPFSPSDSLRVYRLQRKGISLDLQRDLTQPHTPLWEAWLAFLTQQAMGHPAYVLYDPHDGEAFVQVRYRPHQAAADVAYLAPSLAENRRSANAWSRLLDGACVEAAGRGIQRVFANLPDSGAEVEVFQQSGFSLYTGEDIYRLSQPPASQPGGERPAWRPQHPEDWPAIQKLCVTITPQRVRQAEGGIFVATGGERSYRRYVFSGDAGGDLSAIVDLYSGGLAHWVRLLVHPDARHLASSLVPWILEALDDRSGRPVYCAVRQYESGVQAALGEAGFEVYAKRALMVRHTMAWVRIPTQELVPGLKSSAEAIPPAYHINGDRDFQTSNGQLAAKREA